jgi:hypothetical protein
MLFSGKYKLVDKKADTSVVFGGINKKTKFKGKKMEAKEVALLNPDQNYLNNQYFKDNGRLSVSTIMN